MGTPSLSSFGGREAQESHQCTPAGTEKKKNKVVFTAKQKRLQRRGGSASDLISFFVAAHDGGATE